MPDVNLVYIYPRDEMAGEIFEGKLEDFVDSPCRMSAKYCAKVCEFLQIRYEWNVEMYMIVMIIIECHADSNNYIKLLWNHNNNNNSFPGISQNINKIIYCNISLINSK